MGVNNTNDSNFTFITINNNWTEIFSLYRRFQTVIYICGYNRKFNTLQKGHQTGNPIVKFMVADCLRLF